MRAPSVLLVATLTALLAAGPAAGEARLVVGVVGSGSVVALDGSVSCPQACSLTTGSSRVVELTAVPDGHTTFAGWDGCNGPQIGFSCTQTLTSAPDSVECSPSGCVVVPHTAEYAVTARFVLARRTLTVMTAGSGAGTIRADKGTIVCPGVCNADYPDGTDVLLTVVPAPGSLFNGWSGDCSGRAACAVSLDRRAAAVTATFVRAPTLVATGIERGPAVAGRTLRVRLRFKTTGAVGVPTVVCRARVGSRTLTARAFLAGRSATCAWQLPVTLRSRLLRGSVTLKVSGLVAVRSFAVRIR